MNKPINEGYADLYFVSDAEYPQVAFDLYYTCKLRGKYYFQSLVYGWWYIADSLEHGAKVVVSYNKSGKNPIAEYILDKVI